MENVFAWMAWTTPVAIFFTVIGAMLVGMTIWEIGSPARARKGFLPMSTTRGDRLFIGLLSAAYVNLAWAGMTDLPQWIGGMISAVVLLIVMRWG